MTTDNRRAYVQLHNHGEVSIGPRETDASVREWDVYDEHTGQHLGIASQTDLIDVQQRGVNIRDRVTGHTW